MIIAGLGLLLFLLSAFGIANLIIRSTIDQKPFIIICIVLGSLLCFIDGKGTYTIINSMYDLLISAKWLGD